MNNEVKYFSRSHAGAWERETGAERLCSHFHAGAGEGEKGMLNLRRIR